MYKEERCNKLGKYLKQVAMSANETATDSTHFSRRVTWACDPFTAQLTER